MRGQPLVKSEGDSNEKGEGRTFNGRGGFVWECENKGCGGKQKNAKRLPAHAPGNARKQASSLQNPKYQSHSPRNFLLVHLQSVLPFCLLVMQRGTARARVRRTRTHNTRAPGLTPSITSWVTANKPFNLSVPEVTHLENGIYAIHSLHPWLAVRRIWESKLENVLKGNFIP